jgi:hypothetical protein
MERSNRIIERLKLAADVFASSHTCLLVLQAFGNGRFVINNGAAGMPISRANSVAWRRESPCRRSKASPTAFATAIYSSRPLP